MRKVYLTVTSNVLVHCDYDFDIDNLEIMFDAGDEAEVEVLDTKIQLDDSK